MSDPVIERTQKLIRLARVVFEEFCQQNEIPAQQRRDVYICAFLKWLSEQEWINAEPTGEELMARANVDYQTWEDLNGMAGNPVLLLEFSPLWEHVVLPYSELKHEIKSVHLVALIRWEDGRLTPISNFMPRELVNENGTFTEADLCTFLRIAGPRMIQNLGHGPDSIHDQDSYQISERIIQLMARAISTSLPQMQPDAAGEMKSLINVCLSYLDPPILNPNIQAMVTQRRQARQEANNMRRAIKLPDVGGGWDS